MPVLDPQRPTVLAVNIGGAVIPTLLSFYVVGRVGVNGAAVVSTALVSALYGVGSTQRLIRDEAVVSVHIRRRDIQGMVGSDPDTWPPTADDPDDHR